MRHSLLMSLALLPVIPVLAEDTPDKKQAWWPQIPGYVARSTWQPLTGKERRQYFVQQAVTSPVVYFRSFGSAVGNHLSNRPPEWGQGAEGYFHRVGDRFGRFAIEDVIRHSTAAALGQEIRYVNCGCTGGFRRVGNVIAQNFTTLDRNGKWAPNYAFMAGSAGGESLGNLWWPDRTRNKSIIVRGIAIEFGVNTAVNLYREFLPEIKRAFGKK